MEEPRYLVRVHDMLDAIREIRIALRGSDFETFRTSWVLRRAVERGIEIISEASRGLPSSVKALHPDVPWPAIRSIGNHLRHRYRAVDLDVIWKIATEDLAMLESALKAILSQIEAEGPTPEGPLT
jgi:uncharacterized protein with HEPN domain